MSLASSSSGMSLRASLPGPSRLHRSISTFPTTLISRHGQLTRSSNRVVVQSLGTVSHHGRRTIGSDASHSKSRTTIQIPHPDLDPTNGSTAFYVRVSERIPSLVHAYAIVRAIEKHFQCSVISVEVPYSQDTFQPRHAFHIRTLRPIKLDKPTTLLTPKPTVQAQNVDLYGPSLDDIRRVLDSDPTVELFTDPNTFTTRTAGTSAPSKRASSQPQDAESEYDDDVALGGTNLPANSDKLRFRIEAKVRSPPLGISDHRVPRASRVSGKHWGSLKAKASNKLREDLQIYAALEQVGGGFHGGFEGILEQFKHLKRTSSAKDVRAFEKGVRTSQEGAGWQFSLSATPTPTPQAESPALASTSSPEATATPSTSDPSPSPSDPAAASSESAEPSASDPTAPSSASTSPTPEPPVSSTTTAAASSTESSDQRVIGKSLEPQYDTAAKRKATARKAKPAPKAKEADSPASAAAAAQTTSPQPPTPTPTPTPTLTPTPAARKSNDRLGSRERVNPAAEAKKRQIELIRMREEAQREQEAAVAAAAEQARIEAETPIRPEEQRVLTKDGKMVDDEVAHPVEAGAGAGSGSSKEAAREGGSTANDNFLMKWGRRNIWGSGEDK